MRHDDFLSRIMRPEDLAKVEIQVAAKELCKWFKRNPDPNYGEAIGAVYLITNKFTGPYMPTKHDRQSQRRELQAMTRYLTFRKQLDAALKAEWDKWNRSRPGKEFEWI